MPSTDARQPDPRRLSIRELAAGSGVSEGTLRMWEARHGFPEPQRLPSGHRRYSERDVDRVRAVVRARDEGLSLPRAIERARRLDEEPRPSVFAALRERFPELHPHPLPKHVLVRLSHAVEDECSLREPRSLLFGGFQDERFYRESEPRWRELARTAERAIVFAAFPATRHPDDGPLEIAIAPSDVLMREWVVICDGSRTAACLVGRQRPASAHDDEPWFETLWTVDRAVVREASRVCRDLAARSEPEAVEDLRERLADTPPPADPDARAAMELSTRMILYAVGAGE